MSPNLKLFDNNVPFRLQRALLRSILQNYKAASEYCYSIFQSPQAKDLSGDYRRALIEDEWAGIAALFKNVKVAVHLYENNTGHYNEITCNLVKITQSCTLAPSVVPRFASFRKTLASNGQLSLVFGDEALLEKEQREDAYQYAILTHGVDIASPKRSWPWFARVQFPNDDCSTYQDEGIDLFKRFPEITAEYLPRNPMDVDPRQRFKRKFGTSE